MIWRRIAFRLLRAYPIAWRERYETEVCRLIEETGVGVRDLAELSRGLLTERIRELLTSDEQPRRTIFILSLLNPVLSVLLVATAVAVGIVLRPLLEPWTRFGGRLAAVLVFTFLIVIFGAWVGMRPWKRPATPPPAWVPLVLLPCLFMAVTLIAAVQELPRSLALGWLPVSSHWLNAVFGASLAIDLGSFVWPGPKLLHQFFALRMAEQQVKNNRQWVVDCETWIAKGVPSPIAEAEAQVEHWTRERDAIQERIHALGYRARFRHHILKGESVQNS